MDAFEQAACISEIAIVMHPDWIAEAQRLCLQNSWQKVQQIIPGGNERWESSWHAIEAFSNQHSDVSLWFHDAARPFVSQRILADVAQALESHSAVTVAVPVTDTLYRIQNSKFKIQDSIVESIPARSEFMRAQTPQAFHLETIAEAFHRAQAGGSIAATDDVGIVHTYMPEVPVYIVAGEENNRKITYKEDLKEHK